MGAASTIDEGTTSAAAGGDEPSRARSEVPTSRRRSWAWVVVAVLALIAVVAGVAIRSWLRYQPIEGGVFGGGPVGVPQRSEHNATVYSYRDDGVIDFDVTFRNDSRFAATIEGLDDAPEFGVLKLEDVRVFDRYPKGCCLPSDARATEFPLRVSPHSTQAVVLELRMKNCEWYSGVSVGLDHLTFPMKVLGVHHMLTVPLDDHIYIDMPGPRTATCPRGQPR